MILNLFSKQNSGKRGNKSTKICFPRYWGGEFDSSVWGDDRTYQNYIIRDHPIGNVEMIRFHDLPSGSNAIRVYEHIPTSMLPMVYYSGDGNYMLVATKKEG